MSTYTAPGLDDGTARKVADLLQDRLTSLVDLQLTLKHIHWNVVGPNFIAVHEMLDPQTEVVRGFTDELAERVATLGGVPQGTPGAVVERRTWDDYELGRDLVERHLGALDRVYAGVITDHRAAMQELEELDLVSHDMLVGQTGQLEQFQWFVRAHLANADGELATAGTTTEAGAADAAEDATS
jgi:starvation-inducible DNA-binding protein